MVIIARKYEEFLREKKGMGSDSKGRILASRHTLYMTMKYA